MSEPGQWKGPWRICPRLLLQQPTCWYCEALSSRNAGLLLLQLSATWVSWRNSCLQDISASKDALWASRGMEGSGKVSRMSKYWRRFFGPPCKQFSRHCPYNHYNTNAGREIRSSLWSAFKKWHIKQFKGYLHGWDLSHSNSLLILLLSVIPSLFSSWDTMR